MEWRDQGAVLSTRKHGETSAIVEVFTKAHGRHAGVVRGGASRKMSPVLQPGVQVDVTWRARVESSLGSFTIEPIKSRSGAVLSDRMALAGLNAVTALLCFTLPERAPYPALYQRTQVVLDMLGETEHWPLAYLRWELALLEEMGFGLDLSECAATGGNDQLAYVSPRTGRAVSLSGAGEWADRLLPLPPALLGETPRDLAEIAQGMRTTGHFFEHKLRPALGDRPLPAARDRLIKAFGP